LSTFFQHRWICKLHRRKNVAADAGFARAGVNYVGIRIGDGNRADRGNALLIEKWIPGNAAVGRFPDASADCAEIIGVWLAGYARDSDRAAATERADEAPLHGAVRFGIDLLRANNERGTEDEGADTEKVYDGLAKRFHANLRGLNGTLHGITGHGGNYRR